MKKLVSCRFRYRRHYQRQDTRNTAVQTAISSEVRLQRLDHPPHISCRIPSRLHRRQIEDRPPHQLQRRKRSTGLQHVEPVRRHRISLPGRLLRQRRSRDQPDRVRVRVQREFGSAAVTGCLPLAGRRIGPGTSAVPSLLNSREPTVTIRPAGQRYPSRGCRLTQPTPSFSPRPPPRRPRSRDAAGCSRGTLSAGLLEARPTAS